MDRVSESTLLMEAVSMSVVLAIVTFAAIALLIWAIGGSFSHVVSDYVLGYGVVQCVTGFFGIVYFAFAPRIRITE